MDDGFVAVGCRGPPYVVDSVTRETMMSQPSSPSLLFPCLLDFEAAVQARPEVRGVLYTGSLGRGTFDRFSDLDLHLWLDEAAFDSGLPRLREVMGWLGSVPFLYARGEGFATGFVGPDWLRVDLSLKPWSARKPEAEYAGARVVKDTDGVLARLVAESAPEPVTRTPEEARELIEGVIDSQIYLALHNARGAVWSAMGEVSYACTLLYGFLAKLRGRHSYGFRYVETLLSPKEQALMTAAWPAAPTRDEVRRAARALWSWTRHVWAESERALGARIEIPIDEAALLAAVDRIYT
jgi:hypothetical protein